MNTEQYWIWNNELLQLQWSSSLNKDTLYNTHVTLCSDEKQYICHHTVNWKWPKDKIGWKNHMPVTINCGTAHLLICNNQTTCNNGNMLNILSKVLIVEYSAEPREQKCYQLSLKLSLLQKCIRRRLTESALRVTWDILRFHQQDPEAVIKLLRRLPIIAVEDAILHPHLDICVFLMILCVKGWRLDLNQCIVVLQIVQALCEYDVPADRLCCANNKAIQIQLAIQQQEDHQSSSLLFALMLRATYGGMHGDMGLLFDQYQLWQSRLSNLTLFLKQSTCWSRWMTETQQRQQFMQHQWQTQDWRLLPGRDLLPCAVDFHCSDIEHDLLERYEIPIAEAGRLKQLIWTTRSAIYNRICLCGQHNNHILHVDLPAWWQQLITMDVTSGMSPIDRYCTEIWNRTSVSTTVNPGMKRKAENTFVKGHSRGAHQAQQLQVLQQKRTQTSIKKFYTSV